ncbi:MAG: sigma-54 dependent transcriptional regulator [Deltaproteobacteria bacterium]
MSQHDQDTVAAGSKWAEQLGLIGCHPKMQRVFELIRRVGPSTAPVLITGESGTGKELVARALHACSRRQRKHLVPVHCGATPEELLESELFGHVKGAFTGALATRTGRFEMANGGSIFLDEIGEMSPSFQVKLLRVLEDGNFDPVGTTISHHSDARVIAATHRNLHKMAAEGDFRDDLLYRLDVITIHIPALREHSSDIPAIARHILRGLEADKGMDHGELTDEAADLLQAYSWPGNVRELRNVLERAVLLCEVQGTLAACDLPDHIATACPTNGASMAKRALRLDPEPWDFGPEGADFYTELEGFEKRMIAQALRLAGGSKREAARLLQVNRTTLLEKLKRRGWNSEQLIQAA